jgi:hypothetical protein
MNEANQISPLGQENHPDARKCCSSCPSTPFGGCILSVRSTLSEASETFSDSQAEGLCPLQRNVGSDERDPPGGSSFNVLSWNRTRPHDPFLLEPI